jgi:hypothetical protein
VDPASLEGFAGFVPSGDDAGPQPVLVRPRSPLAGVSWHLAASRHEERDPHAVWDCRLLLAVADLSGWLRAHGVDRVEYASVFRRRGNPRSQHRRALAIDVMAVHRGGRRYAVAAAFPRGAVVACEGPGDPHAARPVEGHDPALVEEPAARLLAELVCAAVRSGAFDTVLTPDHDAAHHDHLHLDLAPGRRGTGPGKPPYVSFARNRAP